MTFRNLVQIRPGGVVTVRDGKVTIPENKLIRNGDKTYVDVLDLPEEIQQDFGNYVRRRPLEVLGYEVIAG